MAGSIYVQACGRSCICGGRLFVIHIPTHRQLIHCAACTRAAAYDSTAGEFRTLEPDAMPAQLRDMIQPILHVALATDAATLSVPMPEAFSIDFG